MLLQDDTFVKCSSSNLQVSDTIAFPQGDLEDLQIGDESSQPGQTLLAAAAHSDQQHITPWRLQDSVYPAASCGGADSQGWERCGGGMNERVRQESQIKMSDSYNKQQKTKRFVSCSLCSNTNCHHRLLQTVPLTRTAMKYIKHYTQRHCAPENLYDFSNTRRVLLLSMKLVHYRFCCSVCAKRHSLQLAW